MAFTPISSLWCNQKPINPQATIGQASLLSSVVCLKRSSPLSMKSMNRKILSPLRIQKHAICAMQTSKTISLNFMVSVQMQQPPEEARVEVQSMRLHCPSSTLVTRPWSSEFCEFVTGIKVRICFLC